MKLRIPKFDHFARGLGLRLAGVYRGGPEMPTTQMGKGRAKKRDLEAERSGADFNMKGRA
jgi:hypothetical protein